MKTILLSFITLTSIALSYAAGLENFNNYPETGGTYQNGNFIGQDGSEWAYTQCRGDIEITAPTPCMAKGKTPSAEVRSGTLHSGCGTLSLDWEKAYSTDVNLDIKINGNVVATITGGTEGSSGSYGPITVNVAGDFNMSFEQKDDNAGQVAIDNIQWTSYSGGGGGPTNKPTVETVINNVTPTNNQSVTVYVSAFDDVTTINEVNVIYTINDWSSSMKATASHSAGKVYTAVLPAYTGNTIVKYSAYAVNSYTNSGNAVVTNSYTVKSSDIVGGSYTCRVMAANTTSGNYQAYENPGIRIFQGLKPDIVAIQEFNYNSGSLRDLIDSAFGTNYYYYCEGGGEQIPNGIVSRWPFKSSGEWEDVEVSSRDFAWATIDIPGSIDLHIVSVHLLTSGSTVRNAEAIEVKTQINANFPENDYIVVGGDLNTGSRIEAAINTFKNSPIPLSDSHVPKDQNGNDDTNAGRSSPYDWVLPNTALNNCHTATIIDGHSFANGLVYDSRVTSPYTLRPSPILSGDSGVTGMQHMGVVKDYIIPDGEGITTNYPPVLNTISNYTVNPGDTLSFSVIATDAEGDMITLSSSDTAHFSSVPSAGTVTGNYSWATIGYESGDYSIIFTATANSLESKQMINISIIPSTLYPVVKITNQNTTVANAINQYTIGGTNNANVVGSMTWLNQLTGVLGSLSATPSWTIPNIALNVGANVIVVNGTNIYGDVSSDSVTITRLPFITSSTVAYWRFEEGTDGSTHADNLDGYYIDSSGNGNDMSAWYYPAPVSAVPPGMPQGETENKIALNFCKKLDIATGGLMCITTHSKPIDSHDFSNGFTIECAMKNRTYNWNAAINKDGKPDSASPFNPFTLLFRYDSVGDARFNYWFMDSALNVHMLATTFPFKMDEWYWVACVCDGTQAWLYVKEEGDAGYDLEAHITGVVGGMIPHTETWSVGRGYWDGNPATALYGSVDEVRITDSALLPDQFLAASGGASVSPEAYWRFEEGTNGVHQGNNDDYYVDSSGNGNHMASEITPVLSTASTDVPFANVPQTGSADTMSRTFNTDVQNVGTFGAETGGNSIDSINLDSFTVECMAKANAVSWQGAVVKDGEPSWNINGWVDPAFVIKFRGDNKIEAAFFDETTNFVECWSTFDYIPGEWYRIALVVDGGTQATLYIAEPGETTYDLEETTTTTWAGTPIVGGLIGSDYPWVVGRGMHWGQEIDGFNGNIDEVRISNRALDISEFLGSTNVYIPFVDITNHNTTVAYDVYQYTIGGFNNVNVVGSMTWSNQLTGTHGSLPAALSWTVSDIALDVGTNIIVVSGTNINGIVASDSVTITRSPDLNLPFVDITTESTTVNYDINQHSINGTNNANVVGTMVWTNQLAGLSGSLSAVSSWSIPNIALAVGANVIVVNGTNIYGDASSDSITITRGVPGTGSPFVDITNNNAYVTYDVSQYTIGGTNNINVIGGMSWENSNTGDTGDFPVSGVGFQVSGISLDVGANIITVSGTNVYGTISNDSVTITRGQAGTGVPLVDITNESSIVSFDIDKYSIYGTNNANVIGGMNWSNILTGVTGAFPATLNWSITDIGLDVGANVIVVTGTNLYGATSSDNTTITRGVPGTGVPIVDVTNENTTVTYDVTKYSAGGTDNTNVVGGMAWSNQLTSIQSNLSATPSWTITDIDLDVGDNIISVTGTNLFGTTSIDSVIITRGDPGTGIPFLGVTNENAYVTYDVFKHAVSGTNNPNVIGKITWSNELTGLTGSTNSSSSWTIENIGLGVGTNLIMVTGTNLFGTTSIDSVIITRGVPGTGVPFVDVTTENTTVTYDELSYTISGTNNANIVGGMTWFNSATGKGGAFSATPTWTIPGIALNVGGNTITVYGTNIYGVISNDDVIITRGQPGTGVPFIDITNESTTVTYDVFEYTIGGTNNANVVGNMTWLNSLTGNGGTLSAASTWIIADIALNVGANGITVFGTNVYGATVNDNITITRGVPGTGVPLVDVITANATVTFDVTQYTVDGINNTNVVGGMIWSNELTGVTGILDAAPTWSIEDIDINVGANIIVVTGTNLYGDTSSDNVTITRGIPGTGVPVVNITNEDSFVTFDVTEYTIDGINNTNVVGRLSWSNELTGAHGDIPAFPSWTVTNIALAVGINAIQVTGTNLYGVMTNDYVIITRGIPGTGEPVVNITNEDSFVTFDVTDFSVNGFNNTNVVGRLSWSNEFTAAHGGIPAFPSWTVTNVALDVGDNIISVTGTNLYGDVSSDSVTITRGIPGTGVPIIDITNGDVFVTFDVEQYSINGTDNTNVVGMIVWSNELTGFTGTLAAEPSWFIADIGLDVGANKIVVVGTNLYGDASSDYVTITRGVPGTGVPVVDVITVDTTVTFDITEYTVTGLNNTNVVGEITWSNQLTGITGILPAEPSWSTVDINLDVGDNIIVVTGTNLYGTVTNDYVKITRGVPGTGVPVVDITNQDATVTFDVEQYSINGICNTNVVGGINWSNQLTGTIGTLPASPSWTVDDISLNVGANVIVVTGTNLYGDSTSDSLIITRGIPGTGVPVVEITTAEATVTFDVTEYTVEGTDNTNVVGTMTWSNQLTGITGLLPAAPTWSITDINLAVGANTIVVSGTNIYGATSSDNVTVTRGVPGTGVPIVDITNENATVTYDVTQYNIGGTNNPNVVGGMSWLNSLTGMGGTLPATLEWNIPNISLNIGTNAITIYGTNAYGALSSDSVNIIRGEAGTGAPFIDITNENATVTYTVTSYTISGTNNANVVGTMNWANSLTGESENFPISNFDFQISNIPLAVGDNLITVSGTNIYGQSTNSVVSIRRKTLIESEPHIATNALIFPSANSELYEGDLTNIIWDVEGITDEMDSTNLIITKISVYDIAMTNEIAIITNDVSNLLGTIPWTVPEYLIAGNTNYLMRFEVVDSSSLTNSRIFFDNEFTVVPEAVTSLLFFISVMLLKRRRFSIRN